MKRNLIALLAVVFAIAASSFTVKRVSYRYAIYLSGSENVFNAGVTYSDAASASHSFDEESGPKLNWFRVTEIVENNQISEAEFNASFTSYNSVNPTANLLSDEAADISGQLDLENKQ